MGINFFFNWLIIFDDFLCPQTALGRLHFAQSGGVLSEVALIGINWLSLVETRSYNVMWMENWIESRNCWMLFLYSSFSIALKPIASSSRNSSVAGFVDVSPLL